MCEDADTTERTSVLTPEGGGCGGSVTIVGERKLTCEVNTAVIRLITVSNGRFKVDNCLKKRTLVFKSAEVNAPPECDVAEEPCQEG